MKPSKVDSTAVLRFSALQALSTIIRRLLMPPGICRANTRAERPLIVFYVDARVYGGAECYLATLLAHCDPERFRKRLVLTRWPDMRGLLEEFSRRGLEYDIIDAASVTSPWRQFWKSFRYFLRVQPDVVHFNRTWNYGFILPQFAARLCGARRLVMAEHMPEVLNRDKARHCGDLLPGVGLWRWRRILARRLSAMSVDLVISPTPASRRLLCGEYLYPRKKTVVIPHGVEVSEVRYGSRTEVRAEIGFEDKHVLIGAVGRLSREKGFQHLLSAFFNLLHWDPDVRLCIVGDGPLRHDLQRYIAKSQLSSYVRLLGHRTDMRELFPTFDIFAFPSMSESAGIALLEAMSFGLPVVASNLDAFQGVVEPNETGLLVPPGDVTELASALHILVRDPELRLRLGRQARKHVERQFSISHCVARTYALYGQTPVQTGIRSAADAL